MKSKYEYDTQTLKIIFLVAILLYMLSVIIIGMGDLSRSRAEYMVEKYSGRTTRLSHKPADWEARAAKHSGPDCIKDIKVLDVQWSNCPVEVETQVREIWADRGLGNDNCIYKWDKYEDPEMYPVVAAYLKARGIDECWIHWWW